MIVSFCEYLFLNQYNLRAIFFLLIYFLIHSNLIAQPRVILNGTLKDKFENNLTGVIVTVLTNGNQKLNSITDSVGNFSIKIPKGFINVEVSKDGFEGKFLDFEIEKDTTLSFQLDKSNSNELNEVLIQNKSRKALTILLGGKLSFNPQKMANLPSLTGTPDIIKLLQLTPGVQNSGDGNSYIYVRGGDPGHNLMLYSDVTVYGMAHLLGIFPFYNADHVTQVQFDRTNLYSKYGGRLSSTVSVLPYHEKPDDFSAQGNIGLLASQVTIAFPINKRTGFYISGRKTYIDEIIGPLLKSNDDSSSKGNDDFKYGFYDTNMSFVSEINSKNVLSVDYFQSGDKFEVKDPKVSLDSDLKWNNLVLSTTWRSLLAEKIKMKSLIYYTSYGNSLNMDQLETYIQFSSKIQDFGISSSVQNNSGKIPFEFGFQYTKHNLLPQKVEVSYLASISNEASVIRANNFALFFSAQPKLFENLNADFGLRVNYYNSDSKSTTYLHVEPRIMINYFPKKDLSFFTTYTRQNQYINLITASSVGIPTDFWLAASAGIPSQVSDNFSIGCNKVVSKQISTLLNGYYRSMKNLIEYPYGLTQFNETTSLKNDILVGDGQAYGMEWMLKKDGNKLNGWVSYTLSWSERQFDELNNGDMFYSKYDRRHNLAIVGSYNFNEKWNVGLNQLFSSGNRFTIPTSWYFVNNTPVREFDKYNNAQMPNYIRTDVSVNYAFFKTMKKESILNFSVFNTFNIDNPIYVILRVTVNGKKISVDTDEKKMYSILPSISWRFKF